MACSVFAVGLLIELASPVCAEDDPLLARYTARGRSARSSASQSAPVVTRKSSRFADIQSASFFSDEAPRTLVRETAAVPLAPAPVPIPLAPAPVASETDFAPSTTHRVDFRSPRRQPAPVKTVMAPEVELLTPPAPAPQKLKLASCRPTRGVIRQTQGYDDQDLARAPVDDPRKLKRITEIKPYFSYEPDPLVRAEDPCKNLCPRPDGAPCDYADGQAPECPEEVVLSNEQYMPRSFPDEVFAWEASNVHYNPLYFEDFALERYGHTYPCWVQPFASVGRFGLQLAGLPYQMSIDPICKKMYPLGYYRPGECAPKLKYQIPWNTKAALTQAGVTTGLFFLIP